jgi:leukotriene-A4 hydrolase
VKPGTKLDADDALSAVSYDKGAWFLQMLEERFGRQEFDAFLRGYFDHFAFQSITTEQFLDYAKKNLFDKHPNLVSDAEIQEWIYAPGIPARAPQVQSRGFSSTDTARIAWQGSGQLPNPQVTGTWITQQWVHFIEGMGDKLTVEQVKQLDDAYHFTGTANGEIAMRWYPLTIRSGYVDARPEIARFIERVGRRKLIMPIYEELAKTPDGLAFARESFARARPGYHPITTGSVEATLAKAPAGP